MSTALLDVNVLLALLDPGSPHHDIAHRWYGARSSNERWASCAITLNGCVRILSRPAYPSVRPLSPADAALLVEDLCATEGHQFWPESVSILNHRLFRLETLRRSNQLTDVYLLGLAVSKGGRFVTLDRSVPLKAVKGASSTHLEILG